MLVTFIIDFPSGVNILFYFTFYPNPTNSSNSPPSFRDFHTASVINNNRMYIFGGRGDVHAPYHSQNEIYCPKIVYLDLDTLKWIEPDNVTGEVPTGRRSHSACK